MDINEKINQWKEEKVISEEVAEDIMAFENDGKIRNIKSRRNKLSMFNSFNKMFTVFLIIAGIFFILLYNWQQTPYIFKIIPIICLMFIDVVFIVKTYDNSNRVISEILLILYSSMLAISIGLIYQLYGYSLDYEPMLLIFTWAILTIPAIVYSRYYIILFCQQVVLLLAFPQSDLFRDLFSSFNNDRYICLYYGLMSMIYITILFITTKKNVIKFRKSLLFFLIISLFMHILYFEIVVDVKYFDISLGYFYSLLFVTGLLKYLYKHNDTFIFSIVYFLFVIRTIILVLTLVDSPLLIGVFLIIFGCACMFVQQYAYKRLKRKNN